MDPKTLVMLEYPKILARLAEFCAFSASVELAQALQPSREIEEARHRLARTTEARRLLAIHDVSVGAAHDVRAQVDLAARGGVLEARELLTIQATLTVMRDLRRFFEKQAAAFPRLAEIAARLPLPSGLIETISRCIAPNGEVLDEASPKLASVRREVRLAHERLLARLQRYLTDPETASKLQDAVITQREGRYVIPLRAECKGQIQAIVHDQSSTGATLFVEPLAVVELNNTYRELQLAERDEIRRVLAELSAQVAAWAAEITAGVAALAELDLIFAQARYAEALHATEPVLLAIGPQTAPSRPSSAESQRPTANSQSRIEEEEEASHRLRPATVRLQRARHPLLDPATAVPITIDPAPGTFALVITGPNTGGKTVTLKTVGLLALMAQSGLHIPAESGSELPCFRAIFADIGDEQSIEQSLSTFSAHITNIVRILQQADEYSLVILDELGAGTDPQEGSALARAILSYLLERRVTTFVATHYPELKAFAHTTPGVVNASLEFDVQTLRPTYQLVLGLPGRSNALAIAERLGVPRPIIEAARAEISPDALRADRLIADIARQRKQAVKERVKAEKLRAEARRLEREWSARLEKIEEERQRILAQARAEGELELDVLKANLTTIREALKRARQPLETVREIEKQVREVEETLAEQGRAPEKDGRAIPRPFTVGEKVTIRRLGVNGTIAAMDEEEAEIQAGALRLRARLDEVERLAPETEITPAEPLRPQATPPAALLTPSPGIELHVRGMRAEEALAELEAYLDRAYLAGLPFVRIVHGKGTGKLRQAVRQALQTHPHVLAFEDGREEEGGAGVTVVKLRD